MCPERIERRDRTDRIPTQEETFREVYERSSALNPPVDMVLYTIDFANDHIFSPFRAMELDGHNTVLLRTAGRRMH